MNKTLALLVLIGLKADASSTTEYLKFGDLHIPLQNILHYDKNTDSEQLHDIALIFDEREIASHVADYRELAKPNPTNTAMIYKTSTSLPAIKRSVVSTAPKDAIAERDETTALTKIQRTNNSWILIEPSADTTSIIGQCRQTGINHDIVNCSFRVNMLGYGVKYNLRNSNISLYRDYEIFLKNKLCEWSIEPAKKKVCSDASR